MLSERHRAYPRAERDRRAPRSDPRPDGDRLGAARRGITSALIGASRPSQVEDCVGAIANLDFTPTSSPRSTASPTRRTSTSGRSPRKPPDPVAALVEFPCTKINEDHMGRTEAARHARPARLDFAELEPEFFGDATTTSARAAGCGHGQFQGTIVAVIFVRLGRAISVISCVVQAGRKGKSMKPKVPPLTDEEEAEIQREIAEDPDNPEATDEELAQAVPFADLPRADGEHPPRPWPPAGGEPQAGRHPAPRPGDRRRVQGARAPTGAPAWARR